MLLTTTSPEIIKKYSVENKNIAHLERILKKRVRQNRVINLFVKKDWQYFLPLWAKQYLPNIQPIRWKTLDVQFKWKLLPHQNQALLHIMKHWCWFIDLKTWWGKSFCVMGIINLYKKSTLIIVPTTKLLQEMQDKIKEFMWYDAWVFYWWKKDIKDITITTSKSYCENELWQFSIIIVDECDTNLSEKMRHKLILSNANVLVWMTWTPTRVELNTKDLELFYWPYIQVWDYQALPTDCIQYIYRRTKEEQTQYCGDNFAETRNRIILNENRTQKILKKLLEIKAKYYIMLILTDRVDECEILQNLIPDSIIVHWKTKLKDDKENIARIAQSWGVIIGTRQKMWRWVDVPSIDCVCLVWAFKFKSAVIQSIWRALRKFEGKNDIWVYIFSDSNLNSQKNENKKTVELEYKIQVKREFLN